MGGIIFYKTKKLKDIEDFYINRLGCELWLRQEGCTIFRQGNLLFGFCTRDEAETGGIITFFYEDKTIIDGKHELLKDIAINRPHLKEKYNIYHFFIEDPEGRKIEFQHFLHPVDRCLSGDELLLKRRSIRSFRPDDVPEELLEKIFDNCRFAPTARNNQAFYFRVLRDRELIYRISETRGTSTAPIAKAPIAVAIIADPSLSQRFVQDGCIAAYHFLLVAWYHGLGTCWIAAMDRDDIKDWLGIPREHYIATITPVGYPEEPHKPAPDRKALTWYMR